MKTDKKKEIIQTARRLFCDYGYNGVSMRDIATTLHISPGNLTYHFKRKEDIVEAVVLDMCRHSVKLEAATTLEELDAFLKHMQEVLEENSFYFLHYNQFAQISETVNQIQRHSLQSIRQLWFDTLEQLRLAGCLREPLYPKEYQNLVNVMEMIAISWAQLHKHDLEAGTASISFPDSIRTVLLPLLREPDFWTQHDA